MSPALVLGASFAYLALLFGIAGWAERRARGGRSVIASGWVYALSMAVYCTAWTYFGSVGRAASGGVWFLPIYLGPTLAMLLAWVVVRKMIRIARRQRITSIADFVASRYGKSPLLAGAVTLITVVGIVPYIALQLKAIATGFAAMTAPGAGVGAALVHGPGAWWSDGTFYAALLLAGFTMVFGTRQLDGTERHEGMVAAIAFESLVKLLAFLAVGAFVTWGLFGGPGDLFARAAAVPELEALLTLGSDRFGYAQWLALTLLAMLSVLFLPRQFQVIVVENVAERHLRRAAWVFPLYLLAINVFVLPIALGGLLHFGPGQADPEAFVLSLPLAAGAQALALAAFIGGLSAATGMVIVEAIAVSTMVCNDLVMPMLLRFKRLGTRSGGDLTRLLLTIRRAAILGLLLLGYAYYHVAGEAYALVSIGLISFAAVAQFAPAALLGLYWKGGTLRGALAGLLAGAALWAWTLLLPSIAKSGWIDDGFVRDGPFGLAWLRPEALFGLQGLDPLTHALFWSLLVNVGLFVLLSLARAPSAREAAQAALFVDIDIDADVDATAGAAAGGAGAPAFWRGRALLSDLQPLMRRFLGAERADALLAEHARRVGVASVQDLRADAALVQFVETQLAGAIGSASARTVVASAVQEEPLALDDVMRILDEATQLRAYSRALEAQRAELQRAGAELRAANEQLQGLDRLKDDFMSSVTHELRTPLTSIRALAEMMADDPAMDVAQRQQFVAIIVAETERLSRLVGQVLDLAKIESGHAEWHDEAVDLEALARRAAAAMAAPLREQGTDLRLELQPGLPPLRADADRLLQVLTNLLANAARFVPRPGGLIRVQLCAEPVGATVRVQDNGPGVPESERARIFDRFQQGAGAALRPGGTGLGLAICRRIVEHLGGRIAVGDADDGQGACFEFTVPWRAAQEGTNP